MLKKALTILATAALTAAATVAPAEAGHRYGRGADRYYDRYWDCRADRDNAALGFFLGALAGGIVGNQFGKGSGKTAATIGGAIIGGAVGSAIARDMDCRDRRHAYSAYYESLEYGDPYEEYYWRNEQTGNYGYYEPSDYYEYRGSDCRDFTQTIWIDGRREVARGTACRERDGTWRIVN